ncbi:putative holin [Serratia ficaria]|uniref:putative holin n=1 Tax=Serratia ficaria TaxID=61651 RepID=UPI000B24EB6E|nr:putative holin [Serratia ficaria]CAI1124565.1 Uncharacterised protein [Serratia ficaria]CAI1540896.1 Uncharacterised protein [Serratia ficaria]CAI2534494.1 Uncharacterised protein [Serratia ficaria]VVA49792.1 hypothetical protein SERVES_03551 [Serratia ficaria]
MLINLFSRFTEPVITAAFSGAMIFILVQRTFYGISRLIIFLVSFFMGIIGADTALSLVGPYFPDDFPMDRAAGAFICSALIVTVAMLVITRFENYLKSAERIKKGEEKK